MKTKLALILFLFISSFQLKADGPPVDSLGNIRGKYVSITLTKAQLDHLQKNRYLDLTAEQQKKLAFLKLPKTVDILDPHYRDCTCGTVYGIWYKQSEIAFMIGDTASKAEFNSDPETVQYYNNYPKEYKKNELFIGTDGQYYYLGKLISLSELGNRIKKDLTGEDKYLVVYSPPQKGNSNWPKILQSRSAVSQNVKSLIKIYWM